MTVAGSVATDRRTGTTESWFKTLVETTSTGIFVFRDRLWYVNPAACELCGYSAEELRGMELADLVPERHRAPAARALERLLATDEAEGSHELPILCKNGDRRYVQMRTRRVDLDGEAALVGTAVDVTERKQTETALKESEQRYRQMFEKNRAVKFLIDPEDGRIVDATPSAAEFYGYSRDELRALHIFDLNTLPREEASERLREALARERNHFVFRHRLASGEERDIEVYSSPVHVQGRALLFSIVHDVTEQQEALAALREERERAEITLASIGDGVIRTDAEGRVDYLNPVAERLTGWSASEAVGKPLEEIFQIVDELTRKPLENPVDLCFRKGRVIELADPALLLRRDGQDFAIRDTVSPMLDDRGKPTGAVLVFKDVTELRGMEREMAYLAHHDPLTGLLNRREFGRVLEAHLETLEPEGTMHALLHLDLDGFKLVNDTLGPVAGDEMLRRIADLLSADLEPRDAMARVGSDEFAVLFTHVSAEEARERAEHLRNGIEALRFPWRDRTMQLTTSIGLMLLDDADCEPAEALKAADAACYVAKEQGRNRIHEYRPDDRAVAERSGEMQWIHRIHEAFENEAFCLFRQRIEPMDDPRERMYEIFIRMRGEGGSWIGPGAFVPAAEKYRLATRIDRWVVRRALQLLEMEGPKGAAHTINLSGQSLGEEGFLDEVVRSLESSGVSPRRVCFEITETAAIAHLSRAIRFISVLRGLGCRFILDDFGSGLSSFAYLKNLTVDFLKIDREFVSEMQSSRIQRALVKSIHQIGHDMGIETIAEGIETQGTYEALQELGVDYGQGYWIARPRPFGDA